MDKLLALGVLIWGVLLVEAGRADQIQYDVPGDVRAIRQPSDNTCWATAATILVDWKKKADGSIADVLKSAGPQYETIVNADEGLSGSQKAAFLSALGLTAEAPQNFTAPGWKSLLEVHGLLWVTTNEGPDQHFAIHARIVRGIFGDATPDGTFLKLIDPADGSEVSETISEFTTKFESVAKIDLGQGADLRPQVVHF